MKFLLDQDVYAVTEQFLRELGHEVVTASGIGLSSAEDSELLRRAQNDKCIFMTRDRDFGALVSLQQSQPGVIYLRMTPATVNAVHKEIEEVLSRYDEPHIKKAFVVVEPGRHRYRPLSR